MKHLKTGEENRFCIVAIQIGEMHEKYWDLLFKKSWVDYSQRHAYDILIINELQDTSLEESVPNIKFQKLRLLSWGVVQQYEKVLYLDSDILLSEKAPCICSQVPDGKVGAVSQVYIPFKDWHMRSQSLRGLEVEVEEYYQKHLLESELPLSEGVNDILNGGVMVFDVKKHRAVLEEIYEKYHPNIHQKTGHIDQPILSCELYKRNLVHRLDFRYNTILSQWMTLHYRFIDSEDEVVMPVILENIIELVYFLHFPSMRGVKFIPERYRDLPSAGAS